MRSKSLVILLVVTAALAPRLGAAFAQAPAAKSAAPAAPVTPATPAPPSNLNAPVATVNGMTVTKGDLYNFLSRYQIPAGNDEVIYRDAVDSLVNTRLVNAFLERQRIPVPAAKIDEQVAALEKQLKQDGTDLASELARNGKSIEELRKEMAERIRWVEFVNAKATDGELKKFFANHRDLFNGTQVRASHVLLRVEPKASAEDKEKIRQKLLGIKKEIEANAMTFAQAANKHSEDPANAEGAGGDVGYFGLNSGFIEEFANAAFAMKKGAISDAVETPYGYHLIQITDRKEGTPVDFEQNRALVKQLYSQDLQKTILTAERKTAKIDVKPVPADLFPALTGPAEPAAPAGNAPAAPATKGAAK